MRPKEGVSGLKLSRAEGHRTAATLPALLRSSRILSGRQDDAYRSQKTVKVDGHLGNVGMNKAWVQYPELVLRQRKAHDFLGGQLSRSGSRAAQRDSDGCSICSRRKVLDP